MTRAFLSRLSILILSQYLYSNWTWIITKRDVVILWYNILFLCKPTSRQSHRRAQSPPAVHSILWETSQAPWLTHNWQRKKEKVECNDNHSLVESFWQLNPWEDDKCGLIALRQLPNVWSLIYLSSNSAKRPSKCRNASFMRSVYKLRSLRAWSLVMLRTSSRLRVRSLARGLIAILSISLFMMMEPAAKHCTETSMS